MGTLTLVNSLHGLLNSEIGGLDCHVITTEYISGVHWIHLFCNALVHVFIPYSHTMRACLLLKRGYCSNATFFLYMGVNQTSRKVGIFSEIKNQSKVLNSTYYSGARGQRFS